jgi:hypothetical protein
MNFQKIAKGKKSLERQIKSCFKLEKKHKEVGMI